MPHTIFHAAELPHSPAFRTLLLVALLLMLAALLAVPVGGV